MNYKPFQLIDNDLKILYFVCSFLLIFKTKKLIKQSRMQTIKVNVRIVLCYVFLLFLSSNLGYSQTGKKMILKGSLTNLPDGKMYLLGWVNKVLDSTDTKNGKFEFSRVFIDNEPERFTLKHKDDKLNTRIISFQTNKISNGYPFVSQYFMSDPIIIVKGDIIEKKPLNFPLPKNMRLVDFPISAGKQSNAMFDIESKLNHQQSLPNDTEIKKIILKYPYSYFLLSKIIGVKNNYNYKQIVSFLKIFNSEVRNSKSAKALLDYSKEYSRKISLSKKDVIEKLYNVQGGQEDLLVPSSKKSLIVFWASWCGPCRMEIPELKKLYEEYKSKSIDFISVSVDDDKKKWLKAVSDEKMPWRQLRATKEQEDFLRIAFKYNSAIPYIVLIDNEYKILLNLTGSSKENNSLILKYLKNQSN